MTCATWAAAMSPRVDANDIVWRTRAPPSGAELPREAASRCGRIATRSAHQLVVATRRAAAAEPRLGRRDSCCERQSREASQVGSCCPAQMREQHYGSGARVRPTPDETAAQPRPSRVDSRGRLHQASFRRRGAGQRDSCLSASRPPSPASTSCASGSRRPSGRLRAASILRSSSRGRRTRSSSGRERPCLRELV